jgi:hypothetical protein
VARGPGGTWPSALNPYSYEFAAFILRAMLTELGLWDRPKIIFGHRWSFFVLFRATLNRLFSHGGLVTAYILSHFEDLRKQFQAAIFADAPLQAWPVPRPVQRVAAACPKMTRFLVAHLVWAYELGSRSTGKLGAGLTFHDLKSEERRCCVVARLA